MHSLRTAWVDRRAHGGIASDREPFATWLSAHRTVDIDVEQFDWAGREGIHRNIAAAGLKHVCFVPLSGPRETLGFLR